MSGVSHWRTSKPTHVEKSIEKLKCPHPLSVIPQGAPECFVVKNTTRCFKVFIGNPHKCECKKPQPCIHVIFVLTDFFHLPLDGDSVYQNGLNELYLTELFSRGREHERKIKECPLCKDAGYNLFACQHCGQQLHWKCVELSHSMRKTPIACPKCGGAINNSKTLLKRQCTHCKSLMTETQYRCLLCVHENVVLCRKCYREGKAHPSHPFASERDAPLMTSSIQDETAVISSLQYREIDPEDYETLLLLDQAKRTSKLSEEEFAKLPIRVCDASELDSHCAICLEMFIKNSKCVALPCGHILHPWCGKDWLTGHRDECPIDHRRVEVKKV